MARNFENELFDVEEVLTKYKKSKLVLGKYVNEVRVNDGFYRPLIKKEIKAVVGAIMDWIIFKGILLRRSDCPKIIDKIKDVFWREAAFIYYKPPRLMISSKENVDNENFTNSDINDKSSIEENL